MLKHKEAFVGTDDFHNHTHILHIFLVFQEVPSDLCSFRMQVAACLSPETVDRLSLDEGTALWSGCIFWTLDTITDKLLRCYGLRSSGFGPYLALSIKQTISFPGAQPMFLIPPRCLTVVSTSRWLLLSFRKFFGHACCCKGQRIVLTLWSG